MTTQTATSPQENGQPRYGITEKDTHRLKRIQKAWDAYNGNLQPPLQKTPEGLDPNVMSNRCVGVVDGGVYFLFGKEIEIAAEDDAPDEAQQLLDQVWGRKERRIPLLQKLAMNGAIAGTAFLRIVPDNQGNFRLVVLDPSTIYVQTAPQDVETVLLYCIEYCQEETINSKPEQVFYREEICRIDPDGNALKEMPDGDDTWQIQHWTRIGQRGAWQPVGEPILWPYEFPPVFACQNLPNPNDFWGKPDITPDIIGMNESLNLTQSCVNLVQVLYGQPILYAPGTGEGVLELHPGKIIQLPLPDNKIEAVAIASDVGNALTFADNLRSDIDEQTHWPGFAIGRVKDMPHGNLSGIAIELLYQPAMNKTNVKRCTYGELIIDVSKALLVLAKMSPDIDVGIEWQSPLPKDTLQDIQSAVALEQLSVSKTTRLRSLGYDPEEEANLLESELEQRLNAELGTTAIPAQLPQGIPGVPNLPGQLYPPPPQNNAGGTTANAALTPQGTAQKQ